MKASAQLAHLILTSIIWAAACAPAAAEACGQDRDIYKQKILAVNEILYCRLSADDACERWRDKSASPSGAPGVTLAAAEAIALNQQNAILSSQGLCERPKAQDSQGVANAMIEPFVGLLQVISMAPSGPERKSCIVNRLYQQLLADYTLNWLQAQRKKLARVKSPELSSQLAAQAQKVSLSLKQALAASPERAAEALKRHVGLLGRAISDRDFISETFRALSEVSSSEKESLREQAFLPALQILVRAELSSYMQTRSSSLRAPSSVSKSNNFDLGLINFSDLYGDLLEERGCWRSSSMYLRLDEECRPTLGVNLRILQFVTAPLSTQLSELGEHPELCRAVDGLLTALATTKKSD